MYADAWVYGVAGWLAAMILSRPLIRSAPEPWVVANHLGRPVAVVGGLVIAAAVLIVVSIAAVIEKIVTVPEAFSPDGLTARGVEMTMLVILGFFALGLVDDLSGAGRAKGFRGHLLALREGRVTGGLIKAVGGGLLALFAAAAISEGPVRMFVDAAVIALTANLINLLDLRPGRASKWYLLAATAALVGVVTLPSAPASSGYLQAAAGVTGALIAWLPKDLRAQGMLGDAGSNLLGGVAGLGAAISLTDGGAWVLLGVLMILTLISERYSFSSIIDGFGPLRWFDRLGRTEPSRGDT